MTNAERLREILRATTAAALVRDMPHCSYAAVDDETLLKQVRRGEMIVIHRERVESILKDLEQRR